MRGNWPPATEAKKIICNGLLVWGTRLISLSILLFAKDNPYREYMPQKCHLQSQYGDWPASSHSSSLRGWVELNSSFRGTGNCFATLHMVLISPGSLDASFGGACTKCRATGPALDVRQRDGALRDRVYSTKGAQKLVLRKNSDADGVWRKKGEKETTRC